MTTTAQGEVSEEEIFATLERCAFEGIEGALALSRAPATRVPWREDLAQKRTLEFDLELAQTRGMGLLIAAALLGNKIGSLAFDRAIAGVCWRLEVAFSRFVDGGRGHLCVGWRVLPV